MRVLLDENLPHDLTKVLTGHLVFTVQGLGWAGTKNGALLKRASGECDVFVTMDGNIEHQQNLADLPFGEIRYVPRVPRRCGALRSRNVHISRRTIMPVAISAVVLTATMLALAGPAAAIAQSGAGATSPAKSACSLMTPQEIAGITGTRIRDGEPQAVTEGTECRFRSSDGNWVHVALGPIDAKTFAKYRGLLGTQAEIQAGVGDEAYFWGNVRIYVRVGTHALTLGIARNDQGNATTKAQVLALAKLGAPRLR